MKRRSLVSTLTVVACLTSLGSTPIRSVDVATQTAQADLIVVGEVITVVQQERVTVDLPGGSVLGTTFQAVLRPDRVLKGNARGSDVSFRFLLPDVPVGFHGVAVGQYALLFLRAAEGGWEFVDPLHPALPAVRVAQLPSGTPLDQVTAQLGKVLTSAESSDSDCARVLDAFRQLRTDFAEQVMRDGLKATSGNRRLTIAASLVARNDLAGLEPLATALSNPSGIPPDLLLNLAGSLAGLKDPKSVPTLSRLVKLNNPDINRYAAAALRQSGSWEALPTLSHMLDDPDQWTRYYAVIGFGEITRQNEWAPAFEEFRGNEQHYLAHWRLWAQANLR